MSSSKRAQVNPEPSDTHVFRPDRGNILAAILMVAIALIIVAWAPLMLFWVLIVPAVFVYWVMKSRTTVTERGMSMNYAFKKAASAPWEDIAGVGFEGSKALLTTTDGTKHYLPGVTFNSLPKLSKASRGRIPDPVTAAQEWADGKVEVIDQEGNKVLMTKEEYQGRQERSVHRDRPQSP